MFQYFDLLLGFLGALFAAYQGYIQYLDEKQFNYYKEAIKNLFSSDKEEVMASIATLGVYAHRRKYKRSTIDTLINILYTELDYDVSNAIIGVLIQSGKKKEVEYIASRVIEINRNFFIQTGPLSQREIDLKDRVKDIGKKTAKPQAQGDADKGENQGTELDGEIKNLEDNNKYKLKWHKLVTADVLAMILSKASKIGLTAGLNLEFYQNDFNYCSLAGFTVDNFSIKHSAISSGNIMDLVFKNMNEIYSSTFAYSTIAECVFSGGKISGSSFCDCNFENVIFENLEFKDTFFFRARFKNCIFKNISGLKPEQFYLSAISPDTNFNGALNVNETKQLSADRVRDYLTNSSIADYRFTEVISYLPAK